MKSEIWYPLLGLFFFAICCIAFVQEPTKPNLQVYIYANQTLWSLLYFSVLIADMDS